MKLTGVHHLTAITADAAAKNRFLTGVLGMRRVKKTVNQDDTSAWHLFFADAAGTAGTDLTFFAWPIGPERRGTRSIGRIGLRVAPESLDWWAGWLARHGVRTGAPTVLDGRPGLDFEDPEGQRLRLVAAPEPPGQPWDASPIPAGHQICGLGPITVSVPELGPTAAVLTGVLNMTAERDYPDPEGAGRVHVFRMGAEGPAAELHVAVRPDLPFAQAGAGGAHHMALRVPDAASLREWAARLRQLRVPHSGEIDRYYFRSIYFREPGGVLLELATDGPGFDLDEPRETMGQRLSLPPFLESRRAAIEAGLEPLD